MLKLYDEHYNELPVKQWRFPTGEVGIKIESTPYLDRYAIELLWEGNDDLIALGQLVDALRHERIKDISLIIPYFPYSRQDRRCNLGEGHALKLIGQYINSMGFSRVYTNDPHSNVIEAVVDNLFITPQELCAAALPDFDVFIAPDAGAAKKIYNFSKHRRQSLVVIADKIRDNTGKIVSTRLISDVSLEGKSLCVIDDICDGGATFIELAKVVWQHSPASLSLYVTHGFFTKSVDVLRPYYDNIYVKNLMNPAAKPYVKEI